MKNIVLPPRTEDFTADPVELFFDLAYVFAFSQLVGLLIHEPDWVGVGKAALVFLLLWLPWQQLTWAANAISGNGRPIRSLFLTATVISIPMAASTSTAFGAGGPIFAVSLAVIMIIGFRMQTIGTTDEFDFKGAVYGWIGPNVVAITVLVAGSFFDGGLRLGLWLASLGIVFGAMLRAAEGNWGVRAGHFAERHGLLIVIALGEVIVAIGIPVVASLEEGRGLPGSTALALVASGVLAGLLWWAYFDRPSVALEHAGSQVTAAESGRYARDAYTWAHAPIVAGIILTAAALEEITLHPRDLVPFEFRAMMAGGLVMFLTGVYLAVWRAFRVHALERLLGAGVVVVVALAGSQLEGLVLLGIVAVVIFGLLVGEHLRVEQRRPELAGP